MEIPWGYLCSGSLPTSLGLFANSRQLVCEDAMPMSLPPKLIGINLISIASQILEILPKVASSIVLTERNACVPKPHVRQAHTATF